MKETGSIKALNKSGLKSLWIPGQAGQFGDGLIVRGRHLILINAAAKDVKVSFY